MEGCAYKFIVAENLEVDACECGTGMDFWPSEGLMGLSEPDQVIHGGYFEDLPVLMLNIPRPGVVVHVIRDDGGVLRVEIFFLSGSKIYSESPRVLRLPLYLSRHFGKVKKHKADILASREFEMKIK
jgi:hypothetical protein